MTVGPRETTVSAIAERAGVERLTVYRHFPNEKGLFAACTAHYMSLHPPPDPRSWSSVHDLGERFMDWTPGQHFDPFRGSLLRLRRGAGGE